MLQLEVKMSHVGLSEAARKLELWSMPFLQLAYVSRQGESSQIRKTALLSCRQVQSQHLKMARPCILLQLKGSLAKQNTR